MNPGVSYPVSITMQNTGTSTWTSGGRNPFRLAAAPLYAPSDWGFNRRDLPHDVAPGSEVTFDFSVTAPSVPGGYRFEWEMLQEDVEEFGIHSLSHFIQVSAPGISLEITPSSVLAGQSVTGTVSLLSPPNFATGQDVTVTSSAPGTVSVPSVINVPRDRSTYSFGTRAGGVYYPVRVTLTVSAGGSTASATMTV